MSAEDIKVDVKRVSDLPLFFFFDWDLLHARLNTNTTNEAWNYKKKKHKKITAYRKSV